MIAGDRRIKGSCCCCHGVNRQGSGGDKDEPWGFSRTDRMAPITRGQGPTCHPEAPWRAPWAFRAARRGTGRPATPPHVWGHGGARQVWGVCSRRTVAGVTVPRCFAASKRPSRRLSTTWPAQHRRSASRAPHRPYRPHAAGRHAPAPHTRISQRNKQFPAQRHTTLTRHPLQHPLTSCPAGGTVFTPPRPPPRPPKASANSKTFPLPPPPCSS